MNSEGNNEGNTGNWNTGHFNTGNGNSGNRNTGERNTGNWNTGHFNTGNGNSGNNNSGYGNTGDFNSGAWNTGNFNTGSWDEFRLFDKKADRKEWEDADKPRFIFRVDPTKTDGDMKAAWKAEFESADEDDIQRLLRLPKFSKKVFKAITGIDLKGVKKK